LYEGEWLPEPIATSQPPAPDRGAELASDLSIAFLVLLERLAPEERAAFLLREVFDTSYAEIARILEKSESACRQLVHRARERVRRDRTRLAEPVDTRGRERLLERFLDALAADDKDAVVAMLGPDASWTSDGGGKVSAARNVVHGPDRVARLILGWERKGRGMITHHIEYVNGEPAIVSRLPDRVFATTSVDVDGDCILAFYRVLNPDKLTRIEPVL
jgi:RNA polymerase sigma-70 factor (ECF subfamily)